MDGMEELRSNPYGLEHSGDPTVLVTTGSWEPTAVHITSTRSSSHKVILACKLLTVWFMVGSAVVALVHSRGNSPRREAPKFGSSSQELSMHFPSRQTGVNLRSPLLSVPKSMDVIRKGGGDDKETTSESQQETGKRTNTRHGKCVDSLCKHLENNGIWAHASTARKARSVTSASVSRTIAAAASVPYSVAAAPSGLAWHRAKDMQTNNAERLPVAVAVEPATLVAAGAPVDGNSTKLSWLDVSRFFKLGRTQKPLERGRHGMKFWKERWFNFREPPRSMSGPQNLAGWLQTVPGSRPASVEFSSAGPGWLSQYMGQHTATTGQKMNMHLHRLLFEACHSATMDFEDAKRCIATHGRSAAEALRFLRDIPTIHLDNSKSETAQYIYGSDPYLLGEDWPRSTVTANDVVRLGYHPRRKPPVTSQTVEPVNSQTAAQTVEPSQSSSDNSEESVTSNQIDNTHLQTPVFTANVKTSPVVFLTVKRALHLPYSSVTGKPPSTYVQVQINNEEVKTTTVAKSVSPAWDQQFKITTTDGGASAERSLTLTLFDTSGGAPVPIGVATVPFGGDMSEGLLTLSLMDADGNVVSGEDTQHSQVEVQVFCSDMSASSGKVPVGGHCGLGKTGTPENYDEDCVTGYCGWECQGITVSLCLTCYYGDCVCKSNGEVIDPQTDYSVRKCVVLVDRNGMNLLRVYREGGGAVPVDDDSLQLDGW